jgi:hypothetical protein
MKLTLKENIVQDDLDLEYYIRNQIIKNLKNELELYDIKILQELKTIDF